MRSLKEDDFSLSKESAGANEERDIAPFQLRRRWEGRYDLCTPCLLVDLEFVISLDIFRKIEFVILFSHL